MTTVIASVAAGISVLFAGNLPWAAVLAPLNLRVFATLPWAVVPMAAYLWVYWKYIGGAIGARNTAAWRRDHLRANQLSGEVWGMALLTGVVGFGALLVFVSLMGRVVTVPAAAPITSPPGMPPLTMFLLLVMSSVVAGVTEEAGFRGYMQRPIERRFGLAAAILVTGATFGLLHFRNHPDQVFAMLPYYIAVSALYSGITWAADSILPALVLHAGGDVWSLTRFWATGKPEWQADAERGLLIEVIALLALTAAAWWLCGRTARLARPEPVPATT